MAAISGKGGTATFNGAQILQVTRWTLTHRSMNSAWASSSTAGYRNRVAGVKDWQGTIHAKYDASIVPTVGQIAALSLALDATDAASGQAIVDEIELEVDIDTGQVVGYVLAYSGAGALTMPS